MLLIVFLFVCLRPTAALYLVINPSDPRNVMGLLGCPCFRDLRIIITVHLFCLQVVPLNNTAMLLYLHQYTSHLLVSEARCTSVISLVSHSSGE